MAADEAPITHVLDNLDQTGHGDAVSVADLTKTFEHRSLGILMTVFSLIAALPIIGGIPGLSILTGTLILIAIGQSFVGRGSLWLPKSLERKEISRDKFKRGIDKARPWLQWIGRFVKPRLTVLSAGRVNRWIISVVAALLALTFYPLAFVPWGVTAPALGVLALGIGLMACDGLFVLIGYSFGAATGYVLYAFL